jgi:predicted DNA-binding transcriptional regulator AlpA
MNANRFIAASSIQQFCDAHDLSRSMFYKLRKAGLAPRIMKVGKRTLITDEASADWRRTMEARTSSAGR